MKQQPDGFAIAFNRYDRTKRWGWKQTKDVAASQAAGHCLRRDGFKSRRAALQDLIAEVEGRSLATKSADVSTQVTARTV